MASRKKPIIKPAEYHCCCCFCFRRFTDNREPEDFFPAKQSRLETYQRFVKVASNYLKMDIADLNPTNKVPAFPGFAISSVCSNCVERIGRVCPRLEAAKIAIEYEMKTLVQDLDREEYQEMRSHLITKFDHVRRVLLFNDAFRDSGSKLLDYPKVRVEEASLSLNTIVKPSSSDDMKQEVDSPPPSVMDGETLNEDAEDVPKAAKREVIPYRSGRVAATGTSTLSTPPKPTTLVPGMKEEVKQEQETPKVTLPIGNTGHQRVMCKLMNIKTGKTFLGVVAQSNVFPSNRLTTNANQKQLKVIALKSDNNPKPIKKNPRPKLKLFCTLPECCCGKKFTTLRGRKCHEKSQRQMYSKICQKVAESPSELYDMLPELSCSPPFTCDKPDCEMKLPTKVEWKAHYLFHCMRPENGPASVKKLKLFYKQLEKMQRKSARNKMRKRPQNLRCEFCPARFHRKISFECHMKVHSEFPAPCSFCHETFDQPAELLAHEITHIPETDTNEQSRYMCCPCPRCELVCKSKNLLETHFYKKHLKIIWKPKVTSGGHRCADCGNRRFDKAAKYINHRQNVHGDDAQSLNERLRPILCPHAKCGQRFKTDLGLRLHQQTFHSHKGHRAVSKCHICQRTYRCRRNYETHLRSHARQNNASNDNKVAPTDKYLCQTCGKSFHWEGLLLNHNREVHSEKQERNVCHLCGEVFPFLRLLKLHLKRDHKDANKDA